LLRTLAGVGPRGVLGETRGHRMGTRLGRNPWPQTLRRTGERGQRLRQAIAAAVKVKRPVADQFYGDRLGTFEDPFGHTWHISTHIEDVSGEELARRAKAAMAQPTKS
jgi:hypothetical protein